MGGRRFFVRGGVQMLRSTDNQELYTEYQAIVVDTDAKQAYSYIIEWASMLAGYECFPSSHGHIKDFRFMRGKDWDFAFIPNQKWLLFYFRKPSLRLPKYTKQEILNRFPAAHETTGGEFHIRIANLEDARLLASYIES
jgi:hypothetical protein